MANASTHVLVVDDDVDQLETLCRGLVYLGFACIPARSTAEALSLLVGPAGERIDVVLADLSARGKPGARLVEQLRRSLPELPLVVVTGLALTAPAQDLRRRGVPVIRKPFTPDQLGHALRAALAARSNPDRGTR